MDRKDKNNPRPPYAAEKHFNVHEHNTDKQIIYG